MRRVLLIGIAAIIVVGFLVFMMSYTVRFTESAVVTTFGKAGEGSVVKEPGLNFKWPAPVQQTTVYDTRPRLLTARSETQQTADQRQIIVGAFMTWRVADPLTFYRVHRGQTGTDPADHYDAAEQNLQSIMRSAMAEVSRFSMDQIFTSGAQGSALPELERAIQARMEAGDDGEGTDVGRLGIAIEMVGINSIQLPESATREVFAQMESTRQKLAADAESRGEAMASAIRSDAENAAERIRSFAQSYAAEIRNRGEREAARWLAVQRENPQLAEFLKYIELLRDGFGQKATAILPTSMMGMELFGPDGLARFGGPTAGERRQTTPGGGTEPRSAQLDRADQAGVAQ